MRNVQQLKKDGRSLFPWGPESTVNGAQYVPAAKAFRQLVGYGEVFGAKELVAKAREVTPELFESRERGDLTPGEVARRLNLGGKNPALGEDKFRLEWFPIQRVYCVIDAGELIDRRDVAEMMSRAARSAANIMTQALQMATHLIRALPPEEQEEFAKQYSKQMDELEIIRNWGENKRLGLLDSVEEKSGLTNGNGTPQLTQGKKK
jgi:hypothetical protein